MSGTRVATAATAGYRPTAGGARPARRSTGRAWAGWAGGQRTDHDDWDEQLRHHEPAPADEPDQEPLRQADEDWTDPHQAAVPERGTDWGQPVRGDQAGWDDEQLGYPGPGQADEPEQRTGQGRTGRADWDDDERLGYPGPTRRTSRSNGLTRT